MESERTMFGRNVLVENAREDDREGTMGGGKEGNHEGGNS